MAAAALLERLLETTVDAEQLLDPNAGKPPEDKKRKYGQVRASATGWGCAAGQGFMGGDGEAQLRAGEG